MRMLRSITRTRAWRGAIPSGSPVVMVPTMGALHDGHLALVHRARKIAKSEGRVIVSIFVNPTQFGPTEDLSRYPRPLDRDLKLLAAADANAVFLPTNEMMYAPDHSVWVNEESLSIGLCGAVRPGHFRGVCTVVTKLFNIVQPSVAVFGEKDYQQLAVIRRMVRDLDLPVKIVGHPTLREPDGLAMSSRNVYLSTKERAQAPALYRCLSTVAARARRGPLTSAAAAREFARLLNTEAPGTEIEYIAVVHPSTLKPVPNRQPIPRGSRVLAAVRLGKTRLIDNVPV